MSICSPVNRGPRVSQQLCRDVTRELTNLGVRATPESGAQGRLEVLGVYTPGAALVQQQTGVKVCGLSYDCPCPHPAAGQSSSCSLPHPVWLLPFPTTPPLSHCASWIPSQQTLSTQIPAPRELAPQRIQSKTAGPASGPREEPLCH